MVSQFPHPEWCAYDEPNHPGPCSALKRREPTDPGFIALGEQTEVTAHRINVAHGAFEERIQHALRYRLHLWVTTVCYNTPDSMLDALDGKEGSPIFDADRIAMQPATGCWVCEQTYESSLRNRRCPGEPTQAAFSAPV
jgi:hypothetical protein